MKAIHILALTLLYAHSSNAITEQSLPSAKTIREEMQNLKSKVARANTVKELEALSSLLEAAKDKALSLPVQGSEKDLTLTYEANFARTPTIQPKEVYKALRKLEILKTGEPDTLPTDLIKQRINKKINEQLKNPEKLQELRQLGFIFRNDVARARYDHWIDPKKKGPAEINVSTFQELINTYTNVADSVLSKIEKVKTKETLTQTLKVAKESLKANKEKANIAQERLRQATLTHKKQQTPNSKKELADATQQESWSMAAYNQSNKIVKELEEKIKKLG